MDKNDLENLRSGPGSIVRETEGIHAFTVIQKLGLHEATVLRTVRVTNPPEWLANGKSFNEIVDLRKGDTLEHVSLKSYLIVEQVGEISAIAIETRTINLDNFHLWKIIA